MADNSDTNQQPKGDPPAKDGPPEKAKEIRSNLNQSLLTGTLPVDLFNGTYANLLFRSIESLSNVMGFSNPPLRQTGDEHVITRDMRSCTFLGLIKQLGASRTQQRWGLTLLKRMSKTPINIVNMSDILSRLVFISDEAEEDHLDKMKEIVNCFLGLFKMRGKSKQMTSFLKEPTEKKKSEKFEKKKSEKSEKSHRSKGNAVEACQAGVAVEAGVAVAVEAGVAVAVEDCEAEADVAVEEKDTFSFIRGVDSIDVLLAFILAVLAVEPTSSREIFDPLEPLEVESLENCNNFADILFSLTLPVRLGIAISSARYQESKMQGSEDQIFYASEVEICDVLLQVLREYGTVSWNVPAQAQAPTPASEHERAPAPASEHERNALALAHFLACEQARVLDEAFACVNTLVNTLALANALATAPAQASALALALDLAPAQSPAPASEQASALALALDLATAQSPAPASEQEPASEKASALALAKAKDLAQALTKALPPATALVQALDKDPHRATDLLNALDEVNALPPAQATQLVQALKQALEQALALVRALDHAKNPALAKDLALALTNALPLAQAQAQDPVLTLSRDLERVLALAKDQDPDLAQVVVLARAMALAQAPAQTLTKVKRTQKTISQLFDVMCKCVSLLSMRFNVLQTGELSKSVGMGLALIQNVFHSALGDCMKTDLDGPFFKNVLRFLSVNHQDQHVMEDIRNYMKYFKENWDEMCCRVGLSFERKKILIFLQCLYGQNLKGCLMILKTFIGSGKTASLCLFILLTLMRGERAIYMTPSSNEILRFFSGIIRQIQDLIYSEEFKTLPNSDFKTEMKKLHEKLRTLDVYTTPFKFGEVHKPDRMCVFLLAPTIENFGYALGKSTECKVYVFDDVMRSHELARQLSENGSESTIFIAGADVQDCEEKDFRNHHICSLNIQKKINLQKFLYDARLVQDAGFQKFIVTNFSTKRTSELKSSLVKMGINVNGSATILDEEIKSIYDFFRFLRLVSCDYDEAFRKIQDHYTQSMMMDLHESKNDDEKIVVMQTGEIPNCLSAFISGVFSVHHDGSYVPQDFSCTRKTECGVVRDDVVLDVKDPKQANPSTVNRGGDISTSSESVPPTVCGGGVAVKIRDKDKKPTSSKITKGMKEKADDDAFKKASVELPKRPATFRDVASGKPLFDDTKMHKPKPATISNYGRIVDALNCTPEVKRVMKAIFEHGCGFVHTSLPLHHNTFVANVFAKNELTYLSTNYALESMNLGHVSMIVLLGSISEKDLRQLLGRMNRPNSGTFYQIVEDGRLVILSLDQFYDHAQTCDAKQKSGDDSQNVPSFIGFHTQCSSLGIQVISEPILHVLRDVFRTYSDMFPKTFQVQVETLLTTACIRCFDQNMRFADKTILETDSAMLIGSCFGLVDELVFPIRCLSEAESLSALMKTYGTKDRNVYQHFKGFMHLLPLICAKTQSDLQALDSIEKIERVLVEIRSALDASRFAGVVVSMTTPIMADKKRFQQSHRGWMSIVASILEATTTHLGKLITLLEAKLISHNESLEKAKVTIGAIVSTKEADEFTTEFSKLSERILNGLLDGTIRLPHAISLVEIFERSTAPEKVIQKAQKFRKALSAFSPMMCKSLEGLFQKQPILRQKLRSRHVLELRWRWASIGKSSTRMLSSFLNLTPIDDIVLLASKDLLNNGKFLHHTVIPKFYTGVCRFLTDSGFLQEGQCEVPVDAGNDMRKISVRSFEQLKDGIKRFDEQQRGEEPKFCAKIKKDENDALIAEISVSIDALQKEVSLLLGEVSDELRKLYAFTKMS